MRKVSKCILPVVGTVEDNPLLGDVGSFTIHRRRGGALFVRLQHDWQFIIGETRSASNFESKTVVAQSRTPQEGIF